MMLIKLVSLVFLLVSCHSSLVKALTVNDILAQYTTERAIRTAKDKEKAGTNKPLYDQAIAELKRRAEAAVSTASTAAVDLALQQAAEKARVQAEADKLESERKLRLAEEQAAAEKLEAEEKLRQAAAEVGARCRA